MNDDHGFMRDIPAVWVNEEPHVGPSRVPVEEIRKGLIRTIVTVLWILLVCFTIAGVSAGRDQWSAPHAEVRR